MPNAATLAGTEIPEGHPYPAPGVRIVAIPRWLAWAVVVGALLVFGLLVWIAFSCAETATWARSQAESAATRDALRKDPLTCPQEK